MSIFEKILIVLLDCDLIREDFSKDAGFVDCFTMDPDRPSGGHRLYLMYDGRKNTNESIRVHRKLNKHRNVIHQYTRLVDNNAYYIYELYIPKSIKNGLDLPFSLTDDEKDEVNKFWDDNDVRYHMYNYRTFTPNWEHCAPLDNRRYIWEYPEYQLTKQLCEIYINKKGDGLK